MSMDFLLNLRPLPFGAAGATDSASDFKRTNQESGVKTERGETHVVTNRDELGEIVKIFTSGHLNVLRRLIEREPSFSPAGYGMKAPTYRTGLRSKGGLKKEKSYFSNEREQKLGARAHLHVARRVATRGATSVGLFEGLLTAYHIEHGLTESSVDGFSGHLVVGLGSLSKNLDRGIQPFEDAGVLGSESGRGLHQGVDTVLGGGLSQLKKDKEELKKKSYSRLR